MLVLKQVLSDIAKAIVDKPEEVTVLETEDNEKNVLLELNVASDDMGKVIGKHGRIAKAIRMVLKAAANSVGKKITVEVKDPRV